MIEASSRVFEVVTVTLNPAIDQTVIIPSFAAGHVHRVAEAQTNAGGKGVNVAAALADYGHSVAVTGLLGRGNTAPFEELFAAKRIADHFVRIPGQTRLGIKIADPKRGQTTDINFPGLAPSQTDLDQLMVRLRALKSDWVVLAGSLPPGLDPTLYGDLVAALVAQGRRVALDTSGEPLRHAVAAAPYLLKPNIHELEALVGRPLRSAEAVVGAAHELLAAGVQLVIVSMGEQGAWFVTPEAQVLARPPRASVRSTVGAGDAMVAGAVAALLAGLPLDECARLATAFSLDVITRIGAGLSSRAAIAWLAEQVQIEAQGLGREVRC